jgi:hypothetical protein
MKVSRIVSLMLIMAGPAVAQGISQPPPGTDWQGIVAALQRQRDSASDAAAVAEARIAKLTEELQKAREARPDKDKQESK